MKKFYSLIVGLATTTAMFAQTSIAQWNFDGSSTAATTGTGTFAYVGGVTANTSSPYPQGNPTSGKSHSTINYPVQSSASGTAGVQYSVSTVGYSNISISLDLYGSNTASKYMQLQYTTDGSTWVNATSSPSTVTGSWSTTSSTALPATANNNTNFAIRVVSVFDPASGTAYSPVTGTSTYAATGAIRFDNVIISGTSGNLAVSDLSKANKKFIKNSFVKNNEITFGTDTKDVKVYTMGGQIVKTASVKENESVSVADLAKGNYIVTGMVNNKLVSQNILKD